MEGGESRDVKVVIGMRESLELALCLSPQQAAQMHDCPGKQQMFRMKNYSFSGLDLLKEPPWFVMPPETMLASMVHATVPGFYNT